jgi:hypothetical protein
VVFLTSRKGGAEGIWLRDDGTFVAAVRKQQPDENGVLQTGFRWAGPISIVEVVEQRWNLGEMAETLADELQANLNGKLKVVAAARQIASKFRALAVLLGDGR